MNALYDFAKAGDTDHFMVEALLSDEVIKEFDINGDGKKSKSGKGGFGKGDDIEAKYPLVPQYDERHEAIIILCSNSIDTTFIKNCLGIDKAMSYKNKAVKETSIVTAKTFIDKWNSK